MSQSQFNDKNSPPLTSTNTPRPIARSQTSGFRKYVTKRRWWLGIGALFLFLGMIVGIIFAAHKYYVSFGGQGFLKSRSSHTQPSAKAPSLFLPIGQVELRHDRALNLGILERSAKNVPYYTCGNQRHSCEAHNQPNICCPVGTFCYSTRFTNSNIFCCNSTVKSECHSSEPYAPKCLANTFQCSAEAWGGCCPHGAICAPNGCISVTDPFVINGSSSKTAASRSSVVTTTLVNGNADEGVEATAIVTSTVTERPAATTTGVKQGEVAQSGVPVDSVVNTLCIPYLLASVLVCMAAVMGYL